MDLLTDQFTYQWVHPTQDNLFNPSIDNNIMWCSCSAEEAGFVWRVCCLLHADQGKDIYYHKKFPRIANIPRRLLTLGPKGREEHNVSSTKQNRQWMTWVILARPSDSEPPLLSGRSSAETADFGLFKEQRVTLQELPCSQTNCLIVSGIPVFKTERFNARRWLQLLYWKRNFERFFWGSFNIMAVFCKNFTTHETSVAKCAWAKLCPSLTDIRNRYSWAAASSARKMNPEPHFKIPTRRCATKKSTRKFN